MIEKDVGERISAPELVELVSQIEMLEEKKSFVEKSKVTL